MACAVGLSPSLITELLALLSCRKGPYPCPVLFPREGRLNLLPAMRYSGKSGTELETSGASKHVCPPERPKFNCLLKYASDNRTSSPVAWYLFSTLEMYLYWGGNLNRPNFHSSGPCVPPLLKRQLGEELSSFTRAKKS